MAWFYGGQFCHFQVLTSLIKFGILTVVVLLVVYVPNIKEVFGLAGATVATMLVIVMPAGFYYQVIMSFHLLRLHEHFYTMFLNICKMRYFEPVFT